MALTRENLLTTLHTTELVSVVLRPASLLTPVAELGVGSTGLADITQAQPSGATGTGLIVRSATVEGGWVETRARFRGINGVVLIAGDVRSVRYEVRGPEPSLQRLTAGTVPVPLAFGQLRLDGWSADTVGFNFFHRYDGAAFERGGARYVIEYEILDRRGRRTALRHEVDVLGTLLRSATRF